MLEVAALLNNVALLMLLRHTFCSQTVNGKIKVLMPLKLIISVASRITPQKKALLDHAKKLASQYQKEADKCNSGMETCEEVREKAEEALSAQMKLTAMWERARQKGWREKSPNLMHFLISFK
ncbi:hypothetical protein CXB51_025826 [Gossypium anomalum]|uniref:Uncharacterized protein n=1 Tax=Gossypium anomalum TaxID=47600 RepID=A0A8J6CQP5_9ROSI|nr:hypothetical protein CXB51_025826 [Gossypium anomalum]